MFWESARLTAVLLSVVPIITIGAVQYGGWGWCAYKYYGNNE